MLKLRKGIRLESLNLPFKKALATAAQLGAKGIEINARTQVKPEELSRTGVRHFKKLLSDHQLRVCCIDFPTRHGFGDSQDLDRRIDATKAAMSMAYDLGCNVVSNPIGEIPAAESPDRTTISQAFEDIGRHGQRVGALLAVRTGSQDGETLRDFLQTLTPGAIGVDFDPAELIIGRFDVEAAMRAVASSVLHFRARDAVRDLSVGQSVEVQLGRGSLDLPPLLALLEENNYQGFVTVQRQPSARSALECGESLTFLDNLFA